LGFIFGLICYLSWGFVPLYWRQFPLLPSFELLAHRIPWTFLLLLLMVFLFKKGPLLKAALKQKKIYLASILLIGNWCLYVWGVANNHIVETSLGYFINPIFSIFLGVLILKEKLNGIKKFCIILALIGISVMFYRGVTHLWISLGLALSFGLYGLLRKQLKMDSLIGLLIESGLFVLPVSFYLISLYQKDDLAFVHLSLSLKILLSLCGFVTLIPLWAFGQALKTLDLSTMGFMQYIAPSIQLMIGVFIYDEKFTSSHLLGFIFIWSSLILLAYSGLRGLKNARA
jgi:chloramphenicol-sensitive protein RarD